MLTLRYYLTLSIIILTLLIAACTSITAPAQPVAENDPPLADDNAELCATPSDKVLKVGVLPVLNTLPIFVAQQAGFYDDFGVTVEIIPVESARDRAIAQQAGEIDVANSDAIGTVFQVNSGHGVKIVRHDTFTADYRFFSIVAGATSDLDSVEALTAALEADEAQIAISQNTIIEYLATTMLRNAGYEPEADDYIEVAAIPLRLEQIAQGTVAAGLLPEPLTTLATAMQGSPALINDNGIDFIPVTLTVNQATIDQRSGDVCAFLQAYEKAVQAIAADPEAYRDNPIRIPDPLRPTYVIPQFAGPRVPTEAELQGVIDWMVENDLIDSPVAYEDLVDARFVGPMSLVTLDE